MFLFLLLCLDLTLGVCYSDGLVACYVLLVVYIVGLVCLIVLFGGVGGFLWFVFWFYCVCLFGT